jgi:hypothetical protein
MPENAVEELGPTDAIIVVFERAPPFGPRDYPQRPERRSLLLEDVANSGRFCVPDPERLDTWVSFGDGDRVFYLLVAIGKAAPAETRDELIEILDSIRFER